MSEVVKEVVGTSFAIAAATGEGQQITFQSGFADDEEDSVVNARIDRLMRIVARQRAIGEVPGLQKERTELLRNAAQRAEDKARIDAAHEARIAELDNQMQAVFSEGYAEFHKSGRQGNYVPKGATAQRISGFAHDIEKMKNEREEVEKQHTVFNERTNQRVAEIDEALAKAAEFGAT